MSKRDVFKVLGCEGEPPLRKVTLEAWLQEEEACEYVPGSTVTLEFIGRQMPDPETTALAPPLRNVNTSTDFKKPTDIGPNDQSQPEAVEGSSKCPICGLDEPHHHTDEEVNKFYGIGVDMDHNGN